MAELFARYDIPLASLIYGGLLLKTLGFMVRDELYLRLLVVSGMALGVIYYAIRPDPVWDSFIADSIIIAVNLFLIAIIVLERTTLTMTSAQRALFRALGTLTPGQFRRLAQIAKWETLREDRILISAGAEVNRLYFIDAPHVTIHKDQKHRRVQGPLFAGEIVFLRGGSASATVKVDSGALVVSWSIAELHRMMAKSQPLKNALIARFSLDLADKVAVSVPIAQADPQS